MFCCILCGGPSSQTERASFPGNDESSKLSVSVRFVVRIFLELDVSGGSRGIDELSDSWNACEACREVIQESFEIYRQLVKLAEKFMRNRKQIADKCKRLNHSSNYDADRNKPTIKTFHQAIFNASDDFSAPFLLVDPETFLKEVLVTRPTLSRVCHSENTRTSEVNSPNFPTRDSMQSQGLSNDVELVKEEVETETGQENPDQNFNQNQNCSEVDLKTYSSAETSEREVQNDKQNDETPSSSPTNHKVGVKRGKRLHSNRQSTEIVKRKRPRKTNPKARPENTKMERKDFLLQAELQQNPDTKMFQCPSCDYTNIKEDLVREHYGRHHPDKTKRRQYSCDWSGCGRTFFSRENFRYHMDEHRKTPRFQCAQCPQSFYRCKALTYHRQLDHEGGRHEKKFICEKCGKGFGVKSSLHCHMYQNHSKRKFLKTTSTAQKPVTTGSESWSSQDSQICQLCGKSLNGVCFKIHMWNVHREESFSDGILKCSECQYGFPNKRALEIHMYSKHKIGDPSVVPIRKKHEWQCDVQGCRAKFHKEDKYKSHMDELHGPDKTKPGPFECRFCGKRFFRQAKHEFHELSHKNSESKPFICDTCGKGFPTNAYLRYHLVHTHKMKMESRQGFRHLKEQLTTEMN